MDARPALRVAVLGAGTVGSEVVRALLERPDALAAHDGARLSLAGVAVRDLERARKRGIPAELLSDAPANLVASPDTDVVVELMGGDEPARTLIAAALGAGKPVVSANKHVIAHHGPELEAIARRSGTPFRFEAAVGGGIPVLGPLASDLAANHVRRVRGIVNGTTNYILSAMAEEGRPYADVLEDAQRLGYAEADPSGDVEGDDAVNKLVILARLACGEWLDPATVVRRPPSVRGDSRPGITGITDHEIEGAEALGLTMKLLATTTRLPRGKIAASVLPTCVPSNSPFGRTAGVTNRIEIEGDPVGVIGIAGPGAGGGPTSSAVLADLIAIARGLGSTWAGLPPADASAVAHIAAEPGLGTARRWFAHLPAVDLSGVALSGVALPAPLAEAAAVPFEDGTAIRTRNVTLHRLRDALASVLPTDLDVALYPVDD
jgi:homoserine dehydrogenase